MILLAIAIWAALSLLTALVLAAAAAAGDAALEAERRRESTTPENQRATVAAELWALRLETASQGGGDSTAPAQPASAGASAD